MKLPFFTVALLLLPVWGHAEAAYPDRPVTIVVTSAPGGVTDTVTRALAVRLESSLGMQFIVENRGGGRNVIGATEVVKARADGLKLLVTDDSTLTLNPLLMSNLPYSVPGSFMPIALLVNNPQCLVVGPSVKAQEFKDFIAAAKEKPDSMSFATPGQGTAAEMHFIRLQQLTNSVLHGVPYKGAAPALTDIMAGQVDSMIVSTGLVARFVQAGKLRVLAQAGPGRSALLPNVPTFAESGLKEFVPNSWFALLAPARTPAAVTVKLNQAVNAVLIDPVFKAEVLDKLALEPLGGSTDQLAAVIQRDTRRWAALIRDAKIKVE